MRKAAVLLFFVALASGTAAEVPEECRGCQLSEEAFKRVEGRWLHAGGSDAFGEVLEFKQRREVRIDGRLYIPCEEKGLFQLCPRSSGDSTLEFKVRKVGREMTLSGPGFGEAKYVWPLGCKDLFSGGPGKGGVFETFLQGQTYVERQYGSGRNATYFINVYRFSRDGSFEFVWEGGSEDSNKGPEREYDKGSFSLKGQSVLLCFEKRGLSEMQFDPARMTLDNAASEPGYK